MGDELGSSLKIKEQIQIEHRTEMMCVQCISKFIYMNRKEAYLNVFSGYNNNTMFNAIILRNFFCGMFTSLALFSKYSIIMCYQVKKQDMFKIQKFVVVKELIFFFKQLINQIIGSKSQIMLFLLKDMISLRIFQYFLNRMQGLGDILHQQQIKELIKKITELDVRDYANSLWFKQDENLQKLNMQLHVNALMKNDEYILEECIAEDKFKTLIYDLIMTATWKEKVLPLLVPQAGKMNSLKVYLSIYHESVICNLLEVLMFHRTAVDESGQFLIEVIDYCYKKIMRQIAESLKRRKIERELENKKQKLSEEEKKQIKIKSIVNRTPQDQLIRQIEDIEFNLFIMSISILRYITDYVKYLEIGIVHHLLVQCNVFSILVPLIEERPWLRTNQKGQRQVFQNSKWNIVPKSQYGKLPKTQAQVWIAIYNLFMDPDCRKKYEINDERKNNLLKLRKFLNEVLLDQIPQLSHMLRSLEQLSLMTVPTHLVSNPFVVQQMPVLVGKICYNKNWKELAEQHRVRLTSSIDETQKQQIQRLADLYTNNTVEGLIDGFKCKKCTKQAFKRCSKCRSVWYCSKECQVGDWPEHKVSCNRIAKEAKEAQSKKQKNQVKIPENAAAKPSIDELD